MGLYKYLSQLGREHSKENIRFGRERLITWRQESAVNRIDHPTDLVSAKRLGYKAKKGVILVRVRVERGGKQRPSIRHGRRSRNLGQKLVLKKSYQWIAEERANKMFPNLEVLNSYNVAKDGIFGWYEVILLDKCNSNILSDKDYSWIGSGKHNGRVYRGLTSAGHKSRGLLNKGEGAEKLRPSLGAHDRKGK